MELSNGNRPHTLGQPAPRPQAPIQQPTNMAAPHAKKPKDKKEKLMSLATVFIVLLIGIAVLVVALIIFVINNNLRSESTYVNKNVYQIVNITGSSGGQAYFGHIQQINNQYIELTNVFYLQAGKTSGQFTLNNLSCMLYNPEDTMIIKTNQVIFWQNLKSNSQVTTEINKWYSNHLTCSSTSDSSSSSTSSSTTSNSSTSSSTGTSSTTPSTTPTTSTSTTPSTSTSTTPSTSTTH